MEKRMIWLMAGIGGWIGGYIPTLWGAGGFSISTIIFNGLGALLGIWVGFKMTHY
ncbi:hypothetical protein KC902_01905 [Candidatus Kaiserbacteria bacterium]|nr:hypothetical protein [Candidatus Kaiserbacteria bacterium]USN88851.1 MAG: hypothetical protein H6780_00295 [Candidatus Nomurabacteria bacterium]